MRSSSSHTLILDHHPFSLLIEANIFPIRCSLSKSRTRTMCNMLLFTQIEMICSLLASTLSSWTVVHSVCTLRSYPRPCPFSLLIEANIFLISCSLSKSRTQTRCNFPLFTQIDMICYLLASMLPS